MQYAGKVLRWLGITLAAVLFLLVAVFGLLQTQIGKGWLERDRALPPPGTPLMLVRLVEGSSR
jgi:hypothetical protein